jgi:hypothetical protein
MQAEAPTHAQCCGGRSVNRHPEASPCMLHSVLAPISYTKAQAYTDVTRYRIKECIFNVPISKILMKHISNTQVQQSKHKQADLPTFVLHEYFEISRIVYPTS